MEVITNKIESIFSGGYHEPRVADFFLVNNPKWHIGTFIGLYLLISWKLGSSMSSSKSAFDLRPWMLVLNGLNFGVYGIAIPIIGWLTNFGVKCWDCEEPKDSPFIEETLLRLSYTYLWLKVAEMMTTAVMILRGKPGQKPIYHALRNSCLILVVYFGLRMYARGAFLFLPFTDAILSVLRSAYYVLASPGAAFRQHLWFKNYIHYIALIFAILNGAHMASQLVNSCAGPPGMQMLIFLHSCGEAYVALKELSKGSKLVDDEPSKKPL
ncbi:uncharacterized protein LOC107369340 [Tetranychus urticae]|uniref:Uncharacterized protein n=1 Tax=Tetranychus urticae TaxID=32264 RepID=T1L1D1_TETUR|nr:uncharacterized protein LOC107369340 [Tetranychus urticae]XP_015792791.1 uncharacterized protein LOC107369340 [Tetranychus urticae]XP_015792792.1 uncharacterized protein LOC107369340 [Tetranychus urticae]